MVDGLDGLRHDAVVSGDDEDRDIRDLGAAGTHGREGLMARRVEEDDLLALAVDLIGTDVLRDAAGLVRLHVRVADAVEQRRLAVVDMAHDRDDRRTELEGFRIIFDFRNFRRINIRRQLLAGHAEFRRDERRRIEVDFLVDCRHDAHHEELLDDFSSRVAHLRGEVLDGNRLRQLDVLRTCDLDLRRLLDIAAAVVAAAPVAAVIAAVAIVPVVAAAAVVALILASAAVPVVAAAAVIAAGAISRAAIAVAAAAAAAITAIAGCRLGTAVLILVLAVAVRRLAMAAGSRCYGLFLIILMMWLSLAALHVLSLRLMFWRRWCLLCLLVRRMSGGKGILHRVALIITDTGKVVGSLEMVALQDIQYHFAVCMEFFCQFINPVFGH